jgi:hypothetical protein
MRNYPSRPGDFDERFSFRRSLAIAVGLSTAGWMLVGGIVVVILKLV